MKVAGQHDDLRLGIASGTKWLAPIRWDLETFSIVLRKTCRTASECFGTTIGCALILDLTLGSGSLSRAAYLEIAEIGTLEFFSRIGLEEGMKSRLSFNNMDAGLRKWTGALHLVLGLPITPAANRCGVSLFDFGNLPSGGEWSCACAAFAGVWRLRFLAWRLGSAVVTPVQSLSEFAERLAAWRSRATSPK